MTESERKESCDAGWAGYFDGKKLEDCPDYPDKDMRDEWCISWLTALNWENQDPYAHL